MSSECTHELKSYPEQFSAIWNHEKLFDLRNFDRNFKVGDKVLLREYQATTGTYTGNEMLAKIVGMISVLNPCPLFLAAVDPNYCILSYDILDWKLAPEFNS